jgi:hypothetical protein
VAADEDERVGVQGRGGELAGVEVGRHGRELGRDFDMLSF